MGRLSTSLMKLTLAASLLPGMASPKARPAPDGQFVTQAQLDADIHLLRCNPDTLGEQGRAFYETYARLAKRAGLKELPALYFQAGESAISGNEYPAFSGITRDHKPYIVLGSDFLEKLEKEHKAEMQVWVRLGLAHELSHIALQGGAPENWMHHSDAEDARREMRAIKRSVGPHGTCDPASALAFYEERGDREPEPGVPPFAAIVKALEHRKAHPPAGCESGSIIAVRGR
jgi:hypothetical protein